MKTKDYFLKSFINAAATFLYVSAVAWFSFNSQGIFGVKRSFLIPLFALLLFVISALITGLLVLGKPIHLYLSGMKKESMTLLFCTLSWLVLFAVLVAFLIL